MRTASRLSRIKPSATMAVNAKALELKSQGREVISLSVGEPDFPTPQNMVQAAKDALDQGFTRYTQVSGLPELRQAVADYFKQHYGVTAEKEATIVTNGGKQALYNIFQALLDPGDEVIIPAPYWVSYPDMVLLAGGVPVPVATEPENGFKLLPEELEKALTSKSRMLIINSPSNPTGCHYSRAELEELVSLALDKGLFIVSDEIYDLLVYPPAEAVSLSPWWEKHPEQVAVVNGLAKSCAATGWRIGYALAHPDLIKAMSKLQGQSTSNVCSFAQKGALAALTQPMEMLQEMRQAFIKRRNLVLEVLAGWQGVTCPRPDGAFYVFPRVDGFYNDKAPDSTALCTRLLEEAGVALVPGAAFGDDRCVRISYAVDEQTLAKALDKMAKVLLG